MERKSRTIQIINANCTIPHPVDAIFVHFKLYYRFKKYLPFLLDVHGDVCDALGNKTKFQPILELGIPLFKMYSNLNHSCPFEGDIQVRGVKYDNELLKGALIPGGKYRADMRVYDPRSNETYFLERSYLTHSETFTTKDLSMG